MNGDWLDSSVLRKNSVRNTFVKRNLLHIELKVLIANNDRAVNEILILQSSFLDSMKLNM